MKQKKQNRILAALLAVVMMFQMLPMMAFADEGAGSEGAPSDVTLVSTGKRYSDLKKAVKEAEETDTIELGEGNYTLYGTEVTAGKDLTFVGLGPDKTAWNIGAKVLNSGECDTTYKDDFSLKGSKNVTFKNMTLRSGTADYLGFKHSNDTVVENCVIEGKTYYWGYKSATFKDTVFKAPLFDYAIWVYSSAEATFDGCTFNATGKVINIYNEGYTPKMDVTFKDCKVNSSTFGKAALNINDAKATQYTVRITDNDIMAATDKISCSKIFGFSGKASNNTGHTDVYLNGELVWKNGEMQTHAYTDGERDKAYTIDSASEWENKGDHFEREVTKTCNYCKRQFPDVTEKGYQLSYDLHDGTGAADADYESKIYPEGEKATVAAAPTKEGCKFAGWEDGNGKQYNADAPITLTANTTLTAQWGDVPPVEPDTPAGGSGGAGVVVAGALLGGAGYLLGTRLWLESTFGFVPANRIELAMALWKRADCPPPLSTELYPTLTRTTPTHRPPPAGAWSRT